MMPGLSLRPTDLNHTLHNLSHFGLAPQATQQLGRKFRIMAMLESHFETCNLVVVDYWHGHNLDRQGTGTCFRPVLKVGPLVL